MAQSNLTDRPCSPVRFIDSFVLCNHRLCLSAAFPLTPTLSCRGCSRELAFVCAYSSGAIWDVGIVPTLPEQRELAFEGVNQSEAPAARALHHPAQSCTIPGTTKGVCSILVWEQPSHRQRRWAPRLPNVSRKQNHIGGVLYPESFVWPWSLCCDLVLCPLSNDLMTTIFTQLFAPHLFSLVIGCSEWCFILVAAETG